jgi:hypothetical protein
MSTSESNQHTFHKTIPNPKNSHNHQHQSLSSSFPSCLTFMFCLLALSRNTSGCVHPYSTIRISYFARAIQNTTLTILDGFEPYIEGRRLPHNSISEGTSESSNARQINAQRQLDVWGVFAFTILGISKPYAQIVMRGM